MGKIDYKLNRTGDNVSELLDKIEDLSPATSTSDGLMTSSDKAKLDGVDPSSYQPLIDASHKLDYSLLKNTPTIPTVPTDISSFTNDVGYGTYSKPENGIPASDIADGVIPDISGKQDVIDSSHKLDYSLIANTPTIPDAQIQSDWNQSDDTKKDYIKNKPTIPTVPTNVGAFTNDAGYGTYSKPSGGIPASDLASGVIPDVSGFPSISNGTLSFISGISYIEGGDGAVYAIGPMNAGGYEDNILATTDDIPTISTNISSDASSDTKTASPKAVKTYVDSVVGDIETLLAAL